MQGLPTSAYRAGRAKGQAAAVAEEGDGFTEKGHAAAVLFHKEIVHGGGR
jgi:hypothetical protein